MRLAMVVHAYYLKDARVRRYAEALTRAGHEVDVFCLRERGEPASEQHLGVEIHRVNVSRRRGGRLRYLSEYAGAVLGFFWALNVSYLRGRRWHAIHVHNFPDLLVFSAIIQKVLGAKIVLDIHDPMPELFQSKYSLSSGHWLTRLLRLEERVSVRLADAVIAANHRFADLVEERSRPASKVVVVMNAPDDLFADHSEEVERRGAPKFEVLYIGTVAPRYGLEVVVDAIARLDREGSVPDLSFAIVPKLLDEGEYLQELVDRIHTLGLSHRFRLEEPRAHHEMPDRIREASVAVYPPRPDVHMDIALSLKVPEVVAMGRPLVASRLSVLLEYFGEDTLFLFRPGDSEDCASRLLEVYRNPAEAKRRVLRAQEALRRFSWSEGRREYFRLLSGLISDGEHP